MKINVFQAVGWGEVDGSEFLPVARHWYSECEKLLLPVASGGKTTLASYLQPQKDGLLERPDIQPFKQFLVDAGYQFLSGQGYATQNIELEVKRVWLNAMSANEIHTVHHHYGHLLSGTFYVDMPEGAPGIHFETLLKNLFWASLENEQYTIFNSTFCEKVPTEGTVLMWPSYIPHYVTPQEFKGIRRSIAFDLGFK